MRIMFLSTRTPHHYYFINQVVDHFPDVEFKAVYEIAGQDKDAQYFHELAMWGEWVFGGMRIKQSDFLDVSHAMAEIERWQPHLGIVFGTGRISPNIIGEFPDGILNVHRGIIQKYRGLDSTWWAINNKDFENIGVTIHFIDENLDTGPVVQQGRLAIRTDMLLYHLRYYETLLAVELMVEALHDYEEGYLYGKDQETFGQYYSHFPGDRRQVLVENFEEYRRGLWR